MDKIKRKLFFALTGIVLIVNLFLISAELTDLSKILGFDENTITSLNPDGISYEKTDEGAILAFKGGDVSIKGNSFANIKSQEEAKLPSEMTLNKNGEITNAEFTANEKGGTYVFGNTQVYAPPNSRILFDEKIGIRIKVPDGSEIAELPKAKDNSLPNSYITSLESAKDG